MRRPDGREAVVRFLLPLPLSIVPELLTAVRRTLEAAGYTDVSWDGERSDVVGRPPGRSRDGGSG